ncbi:T9SS C-terminal target domain-containing protein [Aquimarina sp. BL5]|uniref:T9SS type A sorting domain-containing protein n=1 Tax=Aquimarina sp. BL5 TaxID=1714860 RepID=UPI000E50EBFF|nr:T9SS type A sorting domain-containing protein [Aquimarina sp. BL5]AXT50011.1 T9SS C-terminal target domain-containing protein [Aquimarina sp. BL5]RKM93778.1 T9SS C-terminal target domain-containing protein [Aquimarina sp. BL5]
MKIHEFKFLLIFFLAWIGTNAQQASVNCSSLPSSLSPGTAIQVSVSYTADQNRDVVIELWNSGWLGQGKKTVGAGSGTTTITINVNNAPSAGSNYLLKASIRPVGASWQQNINACSKNEINITNGNSGGDNGGEVSINCNSLPSSLNGGTSIQIPISYVADQNRDVVIELWNSGWLGQGRKTVGSGSGTTTVTVNLNNTPSSGSNYQLKASIRPVGGGWQQNIKSCSKNGITIGNGNQGGNVGNPNNGPDTGCTGQDTFDQGVRIVPNANSWKDSYKANGYCFCQSSFDHGVGNFKITINGQGRNIRDICDELKKHPKYRNLRNGDPKYNTIQCGNDPGHNDAITIQGKRIKDEKVCPGRVDQGSKGCKCKGPKFDMTWLSSRARFGGGRAKSLDLESKELNFYPNPVNVNGESYLNVYTGQSGTAEISIHNIRGEFITSMKYDAVKDTNSAIEITQLLKVISETKGLYVISYKSESVSKSKVILVK